MKILFVASEGLPFSKTGGLADVVESLPKALVAQGYEVAVVLPRYRGTPAQKVSLKSVSIPQGAAFRLPAIADGGRPHGVQYYFVDDPEYFDRAQLYGAGGKDYPDNAERFAEFCHAAIELAKQVWLPDVIHCHDWQSALVPVLLGTQYQNDPQLRDIPVVFTIHNIGYQGLFPRQVMARIGLPPTLFDPARLEYFGQVNFLKGGLLYADELTTVSRKYAQEIQTAEYGLGLDGVVRGRGDHLTGILNGVDYSVWNPELDNLIAARYSAREFQGKQSCKQDLLRVFHLPDGHARRPLIGIVSRFADQKGFDLLAQIAETLLAEDVALVALGEGDVKYERMFQQLARQFPSRCAVRVAYDNVVAHKIEAGADLFLMPSRYEPCGLNQIYSLRYGTVPVVRATGGLDDTVEAFDPATGRGTGFKFSEYTAKALLGAVRQALAVYQDKDVWLRLATNGMARDFSWSVSAAEYGRLYQTARNSRIRTAGNSSK